jgi:transcription elongation factor GreA
MKKAYQITAAGKLDLQKELDELKASRGAVAQRIADARSQGDITENSEYDEALNQQSQLEARIAEIEDILQNATLIKNGGNGHVAVGGTVELQSGGKKVQYTIVGSVEADPLEGKISDESPTGKALLGKKVGDSVEIKAPSGAVTYKITKIS